jgi:AcrR family transcriptional regulator
MLDTRAARKEATRDRILDAAWTLARRDGLAALSLRELARSVGMRAPSLYTYFDSKNALYDAMYAESATLLGQAIRRAEGNTAEKRLRNRFHAFIDFFAANPARYQLVVERPVPGFQPSRASFAIAVENFADVVADLAAVGVTDDRAIDVWRAATTGLMTQQIANDPRGTRWTRLADDVFDMYMTHFAKRKGRRT